MQYFAHFERAGAIFLSLRTWFKRWGALLGRYFFHGGSLEVVVVAVGCLDETEALMPRVSAWLRHSWVVAGTASEKSHAIRSSEVSIKSEKVAIPTL